MTKPTKRGVARVLFGVAALSMAPAMLYVGLEAGTRAVEAKRAAVDANLARSISALSLRPLSCRADRSGESVTPGRLAELSGDLNGVLWELGIAAYPAEGRLGIVGSETVLDATMLGLPLSDGFKQVYEVTFGFEQTTSFIEESKLCRDPDPEMGALVEEAEGRLASLREYGKKEEAEALEEAIRQARADRLKEPDGREYAAAWKAEEARSQAVYAEIRGKLVEHQAALERAWKQFERDRPKVAAVAWTLGILELVGWALGLAILPGEIRTLKAQWRARREARKPS